MFTCRRHSVDDDPHPIAFRGNGDRRAHSEGTIKSIILYNWVGGKLFRVECVEVEAVGAPGQLAEHC